MVRMMQVYLLLTESCNLKCSYCIRGVKNNSFLETNIFERILKENDFSQDQVLLTGGEPFLHPQFLEIFNLCLKYFKHVSINTNGVLFDKKLVKNHPHVHIQISLDGTMEVHDNIRGTGSYLQVLKAIREIDKLV